MRETKQKPNLIIRAWKHPFFGYVIKLCSVISLLYLLQFIFGENNEKMLKAIVYILIGLITVYVSSLDELKSTILSVKNDIRSENSLANSKMLDIATIKIEEKIYRKLVSTNAIIPNKDNKLSITARILNDFPDEAIYKSDKFYKDKTESIDLVRLLSYQNLLLTPKYLEYFFYRKDSVKVASRIIVIPRNQSGEKLCQATLTYIFLSARYGYRTFIIPEIRFKQFVIQKCKDTQTLKMIKGNPFILKIEDESNFNYVGEYTDYQDNIVNNGKTIVTQKEDDWDILMSLKDNSFLIEAKSTGFEEYIRSSIANLNHREIL